MSKPVVAPVRLLGSTLFLLVLAACRFNVYDPYCEGGSGWTSTGGGSGGGSTGTTEPVDIVSLTPLGAVPEPEFASQGRFRLDILPLDASGKPLLSGDLQISAQALVDGGNDPVALTVEKPWEIHPPSTRDKPWSIILDLDSSGSMASTDPERLRVGAANALVTQVLAARPNSRIAVADFGAGADSGLANSRWLSDFTADTALLAPAIDRITAQGATPLYESLEELLQVLADRMPQASWQRMMVVFSDGAPSSYERKQAALSRAQALGIPVHAISFGNASVSGPLSELAEATGGIHAASTEASALAEAFSGLIVAKDGGYLSVWMVFPPSQIPKLGAVVTVTVKSGATSAQATAQLEP